MERVNLKADGQAWQQKLGSYAPYIIVGAILIILPPFTNIWIQGLMTAILIYGVFAMSLNLLMGYTGLFSIGHAAFFGVAGYTAGILTLRYGIESFWLIAPAGVIMAVLVAAIFGFIALRLSGFYFFLITLALGQLLFSIAMRWRPMTGGWDGLVGIPYPALGLPGFTMTSISFYYFVFIVFIICLFLIYRFVKSPFGCALKGISEDEGRMRHLGYNVWLYKYIVFIVAGLFAGVAGVLFGSYAGILVPMHLGVLTSTLVLLMVIIGSSKVFFGPVVGAAVVILLEHFSSLYAPYRWPLILGGFFILCVMFLPGGISVYLSKLWQKVRYSYGSAKD